MVACLVPSDVVVGAGVVRGEAEGGVQPLRDLEVAVGACPAQGVVVACAGVFGCKMEGGVEPPRDIEVVIGACLD